MQKKSDFKVSKVSSKKKTSKQPYKRNSLIFCSFILLICSIVVRFINSFTEGTKNLFLAYSNLQDQLQNNGLSCREDGEMICI